MPRKEERKKKIKKPETFKAGGVELTREEFEVVKGGAGKVTEKVREAEASIRRHKAAATPQLLSEAERAQVEAPRIEEAKKVLEEREVLKQPQPERVELDIERKGLPEELPVIGGTAKAGTRAIMRFTAKLLGRDVSSFKGEFADVEPLLQNPETRRELFLQEIQKEVIKQDSSQSEKFGAMIESIPIVGGAVAKYTGDLIESPSENVKTIVADIEALKETASSMREQAQTGKIDPYDAIDRIEGYENQVAELEQRIRILSMESAELVVDADALNLIETKILEVRRRLFNAKQAAAAGLVLPATETNLYLALKELKGGKK